MDYREYMDESRIEDFANNCEDLEFNYYGQREYIEPSDEDYDALCNMLICVAVKAYKCNLKEKWADERFVSYIPNDFLKKSKNINEADVEINNLRKELYKINVPSEYYANETINLGFLFDGAAFKLASPYIHMSGGKKFYSSILGGTEVENFVRVYVPCNSEYCYRFARYFIQKSFRYGINFEFKIMNIEFQKNGADNIVMYIPKDKLSNAIKLINEIKIENPDITFGLPHMFGYQVNDYIAVAPEREGTSYSSWCKNLLKNIIKQKGKNEDFADYIIGTVDYELEKTGIVDLIDELVKKGEIPPNKEQNHGTR